MPRQRSHNEWFQTTTRCRCDCGLTGRDRATKGLDPQGYIWGEYVSGRWRTIQYVCQNCFPEVLRRLKAHTDPCGCTVNFCARSGHDIPEWMTDGEAFCNANSKVRSPQLELVFAV